MSKLTADQINDSLESLADWSEVGGVIQKTYQFDDFKLAMGFVHSVADAAETAQHHPDILIRYNKVTLSLSTHDAGGITEKDFDLARTVDGFA